MPHHILEKQEGGKGSWNPKGTNDFLLSNCKVASICYENETCTVSHRQDPAIGETVQGKISSSSFLFCLFIIYYLLTGYKGRTLKY